LAVALRLPAVWPLLVVQPVLQPELEARVWPMEQVLAPPSFLQPPVRVLRPA
jgi:hypothetical protein